LLARNAPASSASAGPSNDGLPAGVPVPSWALHHNGIRFIPTAASAASIANAAARSRAVGGNHPSGELGRRCEPEYCPTVPLFYKGGTVQHNPVLHVIFWGSSWNEAAGSALRTQMMKLYEGIGGSAWQGVLTQYFDVVRDKISYVASAVTADSITDPAPAPNTLAPKEVTDEKLQEEVAHALILESKWSREPNAQFIVIPGPGSTYSPKFLGSFCAYHNEDESGSRSSYSFVPNINEEPFRAHCIGYDSNGNGNNVTSMVASHEYAESATDPLPGSNPGWQGLDGNEIGDICVSGDDEIKNGPLSGSWVQGSWDDHQSACSLADENPPHVLGLTEAASKVSRHEGTLNGSIYPEGLETTYHFEYDTRPYAQGEAPHGVSIPVTGASVGSGMSLQHVQQTISGLSVETTYHYRVVATNSSGTTYGVDQTLRTSEWSVPTLPRPTGAGSTLPTSVSCVTREWCMFVGRYWEPQTPYSEIWNGIKWSVRPVPAPAGTVHPFLNGVSCASTSSCSAVGEADPSKPGTFTPFVEHWDGTSWTIESLALPSGATEAGLMSVSCVSATECMAAGWAKGASGTTVPFVALRSQSGSWSEQTLPPVSGGGSITELHGISCASASACMAVGRTNGTSTVVGSGTGFAESWNGKAWSIVSPATPTGEEKGFLSSVSCTSANQCIAVGEYLGPHPSATNTELYWGSWIEKWNGEKETWSEQAYHKPSESVLQDGLGSVSCTGPESCTAVGSFEVERLHWVTLVENYNGKEWQPQTTSTEAFPERTGLGSVSCVEAANCAAVGIYVIGGFARQLAELRLSTTGPKVFTEPASELAKARATLNALVNPNGTPITECKLEYGTTTSYGSHAACTPSPGAVESVVSVSAALAGLSSGTTYHFRIAVTSALGTIYGADETFELSATAAGYLSSFPSAGSSSGGLSTQGVAVDGSGNVWVSDAVNHRVNEFSSQGAFKLAFGFGVNDEKEVLETCTANCKTGLTGSKPGEFGAPGAYGLSIGGIAVSGADIWVVDGGNERIEEFTTAGTTPVEYAGRQIRTLLGPEAVATDSSGNNIWVSSYGYSALQDFSFSPTGTVEEKHVIEPPGNKSGLAVDAQGNVWAAVGSVGVAGFDRVDEYSPNATFEQSFGWHVKTNGTEELETCTTECLGGTAGSGNGQFNQPHGVAVDGHGDVFVVDTNNNRVQEFSATGKYITQFGSSGSGAFEFSGPLGIAVAGGQAYVVDAGNNRVENWEVWENLPPTVETHAASAITQSAATLNASVNPNGSEATACTLEYGTTTSYGSSAPCTPSPGTGGNPVAVSASVAGLTANTTYHFRISATNSGGTSNGSDQTLKTLPEAPAVLTGTASSVTQTSATLGAYVNPNGAEVSECKLEWGTTTAYGSSARCTPSPGSGSSGVEVSAAVSGLTPITTYHFRVSATNSSGTSRGSDRTFTTLTNFPATESLDTFIRAAENPLSNGGKWSKLHWTKTIGRVFGPIIGWVPKEGGEGAPETEADGAYWNVQEFANPAVSTHMLAQNRSGDYVGIWCDTTGGGHKNGYRLKVVSTPTSGNLAFKLILEKWVNGTRTQLGESSVVFFSGSSENVVGLTAINGQVKGWHGTSEASLAVAVEASDATLGRGFVGIEGNDSNAFGETQYRAG
jgi:phosphodiesterase/alkaline phosphatase D-like protein